MDKIHFSYDDWSAIVNRYLGHHSNFKILLPQLQEAIETSCKKNQALKSARENLNRLSMTTLIECMIDCISNQEKAEEEHPKPDVEDRLSLFQGHDLHSGRQERHRNICHEGDSKTSPFKHSQLRALELYCANNKVQGSSEETANGLNRPHINKEEIQTPSRVIKRVNEAFGANSSTDPTLELMKEKKYAIRLKKVHVKPGT